MQRFLKNDRQNSDDFGPWVQFLRFMVVFLIFLCIAVVYLLAAVYL